MSSMNDRIILNGHKIEKLKRVVVKTTLDGMLSVRMSSAH
jgi:hypothetical protein